ncbi:YcnI family copper-binding membrane protein [Bradyrhizobium diversitatis]|uniref:YcnI family protein n=1 Tax=Bradyrhizobium diversitatis TaxID=2755406 RepID=A0ABS0P5R5_9BRAD|nr:YcnI family protein [Bradyrhizobium diversitatis]MBH5388578.1 YcnI family protein [Bradyrhizobium diversitatis]
MRTTALIVIAAALCAGTAAQAHTTLGQKEAAIGGPYLATFRVPHGCGNSPTVKVRVQIPVGVVGVKPMPKPGWQLDLVKGKYDKPYAMFHGSVTEGVKEVSWSGRLPDDFYDEFVLSTYLTDDLVPGQMLYFPVVQECESGIHRWIEIPMDGKSAADYKEPAPGVKLLPKQ